jgi:hypothetical protein
MIKTKYDSDRSIACALVCNPKLSAAASVIETFLARNGHVDAHIFVEGNAKGTLTDQSVADERVFFHYDRLLVRSPIGLPEGSPNTLATWGRIFVPEVLNEYDRLLYLDVDTMPAFKKPSIAAIDLPYGLGMVRDANFLIPSYESTEVADARDKIDRLYKGDYFNAGVMLIDPGNWDPEFIHYELVRFLESGGDKAKFYDQDFLNFAFSGKVAELSPNLNFQYPLMKLGIISEGTPTVRHYNSFLKPYHLLPAVGASKLLRAAAEEFHNLHPGTECTDLPVRPDRTLKTTSVVKGQIRKVINELGIGTWKGRRLKEQWCRHRREALCYLSQGVETRQFADEFDLILETKPIKSEFDGFDVLAQKPNGWFQS